MPLSSLLPFEEAKTALTSFLGHPEGDERAKAVRVLIGSVLQRPEPEARLDLLRRCAYLPVTDGGRRLLRALVKHLGAARPDEALAAANAVQVRMTPD